MVIDASELFADTILIILHPTGIKYTVQAGGMMCSHPEAEGIAMSLGEYASDIDDCSFGCEYLYKMPEKRKELAEHIDEYFTHYLPFPTGMKLKFDYSRLYELIEGWWPVLVSGYWGYNTPFKEMKGYLHTGNCD